MGQDNNVTQQTPEANEAAPGPVQGQQSENTQKAPGGKRSPWTIVLVVSLLVFVIAVGALCAIAFSYFQGQQKYHELEEFATVSEEKPLDTLAVNWESLLAVNPDTVAWLFIPNTVINYPVVQHGDNDYYLTHDFTGEQGWLANYGAIFMDAKNKPGWLDDAYFIYGHHMNDGSMFADIVGMQDQARFDECRTIYMLSQAGNFKLRTFALIHCSSDDPIVQTSFGSRKDMADYIQDKIDRSIVNAGDIPAPGMMYKIFAFSTCDNVNDARYVLFAYVEDTTAENLVGMVGTATGDDDETVLVNELREEE